MLDLLLIFVAAPSLGWMAARHWRRTGQPLASGFGLRRDRAGLNGFGAGFSIAAMAMLGIFGAEWALGGIHVLDVRPEPAMLLREFFSLLLFALFEEVVFRMLLLSGLVVVFRGRHGPAIALSAVLFGLVHLINPGATALSVLGNAMGGVIYGMAFLKGRSLWLALGLHLGWNFFQGPVLGFAISGDSSHVAMVRLLEAGPAWLTGGAYGPEAGTVGMGFRVVVLVLLIGWLRRQGGSMDSVAPRAREKKR